MSTSSFPKTLSKEIVMQLPDGPFWFFAFAFACLFYYWGSAYQRQFRGQYIPFNMLKKGRWYLVKQVLDSSICYGGQGKNYFIIAEGEKDVFLFVEIKTAEKLCCGQVFQVKNSSSGGPYIVVEACHLADSQEASWRKEN